MSYDKKERKKDIAAEEFFEQFPHSSSSSLLLSAYRLSSQAEGESNPNEKSVQVFFFFLSRTTFNKVKRLDKVL